MLWLAGADQQPGRTRAACVGVDAADAEFGLGAGGGLGRDMSRPREHRCHLEDATNHQKKNSFQ